MRSADLRRPLPAFDMHRNPDMPAGIVAWQLGVPLICLVRNITQVGDAIVGAVAVDMINLASRPPTVMHRPGDSVGIDEHLVDASLPITVQLRDQRLLSRELSVENLHRAFISAEVVRCPLFPCEQSCFGVVIQKVT